MGSTSIKVSNPDSSYRPTKYSFPVRQDTSLVSPMITPSPTSMAGILALTGVGGAFVLGAEVFTEFAKGLYAKRGMNNEPVPIPKPSTGSDTDKIKKPVAPVVPSVTLTPNSPLTTSLSESNKMSEALIKTLNDGFVLLGTVLYEGFIDKRDSDYVKNVVLGQIANELGIANEIKGAYEDAHLNNSKEIANNNLEWEGYKFGELEQGAILTTTQTQTALDTTIAYNELTQRNQLALNANLEALVKVTAKTKEELDLVAKKLDYYTKETTEIQLDNFTDDIPALTPQMYRAHKDAIVAKKNSDENTFELDDDDYNSMFNFPDLSELLKYPKISDYLMEARP